MKTNVDFEFSASQSMELDCLGKKNDLILKLDVALG